MTQKISDLHPRWKESIKSYQPIVSHCVWSNLKISSPPWSDLPGLAWVAAWLARADTFSFCHTTQTHPQRAHQHAQMLPCPHDKGEDHLMLFTLYSPLKDTDLYQGWPALCVPPSSTPISHWVMERLLMLLKGQQDKREMQRMLNTKPMTPDTPHPSLSAPEQTLFLPAIPPLNCRPSRSYLHIVELC